MQLYPVSVTMFRNDTSRELHFVQYWENDNASVSQLILLFTEDYGSRHWSILNPVDIPRIGKFVILLIKLNKLEDPNALANTSLEREDSVRTQCSSQFG